MDNYFQHAVLCARQARSQFSFDEAFKHFTYALQFFHAAVGYKDPELWSNILLERAECSLILQHYKEARDDISRALDDCPQPVYDHNEATKWLEHADQNTDRHVISLSCYSAALHFSAGDHRLQSIIYGSRALIYNEIEAIQECYNDIGNCRTCDPETALERGSDCKENGIHLFNQGDYNNSFSALRLAEKFLRPFGSDHSALNGLRKKHLRDSLIFMACAAWKLRQYSKALRAGKNCFDLKPVVDKNEASRWKLKGNEIIKDFKYDLAVECYSLAIHYAPLADAELQGILHSNRSSAYFKMKQYEKAKEDAEKCLKYRPQWSKSFYRLGSALLEMQQHQQALDVLKDGLNSKPDRDELFFKIMSIVSSCKDGPKMITFELPLECLRSFLKERADKEDWGLIELLFLGGGGQQSYPEGAGGIATGCDVSHISLSQLIKSKKKVNQFEKLLNVLIDHGASVNRLDDLPPLSVAVNEKNYESAVLLLKKKADATALLRTKIRKQEDTPIHTAFRTGLSSGSWRIFVYLMDNYEHSEGTSDSISTLNDSRGNSLFHLLASGERMSQHTTKAVELLKKYNFDPRTLNKDGQTPLMMLPRRKDARYRLIDECVKYFPCRISKKKSSSTLDEPLTSSQSSLQPNEDHTEEPTRRYEEVRNVHHSNKLDILREQLAKAIDNLEMEVVDGNAVTSRTETTPSTSFSRKPADNEGSVSPLGDHDHIQSPDGDIVDDKRPLPTRDVNANDLSKEKDEFEEDSDVMFHNLTWEVECTSEVWKIFKDKRLSPVTKKRIVNIIRQLANGHMRGNLAKRLEGLPKQNNILLFEAKLGKGERILWERAIAFSPRSSDNPELLIKNEEERVGVIYSEIIRIWDIVFDHDTVPRKIEKIVRSHKRGLSCFIKKQLRCFKVEASSSTMNKDLISIPNLYSHKDDLDQVNAMERLVPKVESKSENKVSTMFFPPGSPEETEYHILKFYAFSNSLVNAVLAHHGKTNVDFPFQVSELEHAVINLKPCPMTSLLLLGRSGTGKTTCCLYRLWCNFQTYWQQHTIDQPSIPKMAQFIHKETENDVTDVEGGSCGEEDEGCHKLHETDNEDRSGASRKSLADVATNSRTLVEQDIALCSQATCEDPKSSGEGPIYEHLHQVFITKNAVLCTEVRKNFLDLCHACSATQSHSEYERPSSVNKFNQLEEQAWPLFVCSHDWLLMLDASLPGPEFFPRNDEGELLRSVKGWGEEDSHLQEIPEDNSEDEDDDEFGAESNPKRNEQDHDDLQAVSGIDPRLEVTYQVFKNELWPKMTKKRKVDYHPILVWTEIRSFIKGSVEALHSKDGYITQEEYQTLGRKRAPSFSADRKIVYKLFLSYQRIKRSKGMFDEADLVYNIYHRLQRHVPEWSIHEIYVDETQDFTQAELFVIIRCCRDPNRLFFTGDTAQSIMRGIAFRFNDLKSLFYYMKESYKAVGHQAQVRVPDRVYQLTHNYRSHTGILDVACSVIDLLVHFFPESFDRMARDQGLFQGPKPVLLESCNVSDLAVILRGHKRKTSPIEFGAHQVVLVASDEVRDSLPEELSRALIMTIYEAKGLEFDDVLIYNFFKDSQAQREWRVVTSYKEGEYSNVVSEAGIAEIPEDNLETKTRRLEFNPDRHKILISEFKYLYTALTRARVNVWLFDEDEEARAPMFEYFKKRGVVEVKRPQKTSDDKVSLEGIFAEKSTKEEWRNEGHFFYGKALWKFALQCFIMADDETMVRKCHAQIQAVKAASLRNEPRKLRIEFAKAADMFLQCGMRDKAGICLYNARERFLLAKLHGKCGYFLKAAKLFRKEKKFLEASENFEKGLDFMRAVDCLLQINHYDQALNVIAKCQELIPGRNDVAIVSLPGFDQRYESICYQAAEYYLKRGQLDLMTSALEKLPEIKDRMTFLRKNGCIEQAAKLLVQEGKGQEAAEMMRSNGKFLEAASLTNDDKFAAECHLLATRSVILSKKKREKPLSCEETEKIVDVPLDLQRAGELYTKCNDLNGQAEVKLLRGKLYCSGKEIHEAWNLYYRARNYAGLAECFLLLIDMENDPKTFPREKALHTVHNLFYLIMALHKKNQENADRTAISMCETYFGLVETEDTRKRKVPRLEMVRFRDSQIGQEVATKEEIDLDDAYRVMKERLYDMAHNVIQLVWDKQQCINEQYEPCPRYLSDALCEEEDCKYYHGDLTRQPFADRFYSLFFLVHLDATVANFLKDLRRESAKIANHLRQLLSVPFKFQACRRLMELLFSRSVQLGKSYLLAECDVVGLRNDQIVRDRIIEYAKSIMWKSASQEERWSDSDLFIAVSNLMHLAAAPADEIFNLLSVEERKFENTCSTPPTTYGFFPDTKNRGCFEIFTKWLEHSKIALYQHGNVLRATHSVVAFLFTPAKRKNMPYPSVANAIMILEYYMTACLLLHARLVMNDSFICLPASYLSLIKFWDIINISKPNQSTLYHAIQRHTSLFLIQDTTRQWDRLHMLTKAMITLMFGGISRRYNIFTAALCDESVSCDEAERALILALTMLCNCGRGIPESCEVLIRQQFMILQVRSHLPNKLNQCIEAVRLSHGMFDVVNALQELLCQKPRQEQLLDVKWDEINGNDFHMNCQSELYPKVFRFQIDVDEIPRGQELDSEDLQDSKDVHTKDDFMDDFQQSFGGEDEAYSRGLNEKKDENVRETACLTIQRAFSDWKERKLAITKKLEKIRNDPVEYHFLGFKLDKSGCTICNVQFEEHDLDLSDTNISLPSSSQHDVEETNSNWQPRILKGNSLNSHCSRRSPHWKKERQFKQFKDVYRRDIYPTLEKAQKVVDEMKVLRNNAIVCALELDRLDTAISRLQSVVKKVEKECTWDSVLIIMVTARDVVKAMEEAGSVKGKKGIDKVFKEHKDVDREDSGEDDDYDGGEDIKEINVLPKNRKNGKSKSKTVKKRK